MCHENVPIFFGRCIDIQWARKVYMPLPLKSKILETPGSLVTDDTKMFPLWIWTLNLQASLMVQYELSRIRNYSATCPPKVNKLNVPIFLKKKEILPLMGGKKFFSTEEKCYLMGWGEYGVKSKDIVPREGPSQRAENMQRMLKGSTYTTFPPMMTSSSFDLRAY